MKESHRAELIGALAGGIAGLSTGFAASLTTESTFAKLGWGIIPTVVGGTAGFYLGRLIAPKDKEDEGPSEDDGKGLGVFE